MREAATHWVGWFGEVYFYSAAPGLPVNVFTRITNILAPGGGTCTAVLPELRSELRLRALDSSIRCDTSCPWTELRSESLSRRSGMCTSKATLAVPRISPRRPQQRQTFYKPRPVRGVRFNQVQDRRREDQDRQGRRRLQEVPAGDRAEPAREEVLLHRVVSRPVEAWHRLTGT